LWLIFTIRRTSAPRKIVRPALWFATPLALAIALLLAQNVTRFGSPLDFGYLSMKVAGTLAPDLLQYGQFNVHFLPRNLAALLLTPPTIAPINLTTWLDLVGGPAGLLRRLTVPSGPAAPRFPITFDWWGTGLWVVSPALGFTLRRPDRANVLLFAASWLSALLVAIPDLLYYNTGWVQYGDRFSQDFLPFLLLLTAIGLRRPLRPAWRALFAVLLAVSIASNFLGARWFLGLPPYVKPLE
jgi:hypothetical protein